MRTIRLLCFVFIAVVWLSERSAYGQGAYVGATSGIWIGGVHHTCTVINPQGQLHCVPSGK